MYCVHLDTDSDRQKVLKLKQVSKKRIYFYAMNQNYIWVLKTSVFT